MAKDSPAVAINKVEHLMPSLQHQRVTRELTQRLRARHYLKISVDDALSERLLASYVDKVDGERLVFRKSDVAAFGQHRKSLDDALRAGNLVPAFTIFNYYRKRLLSLLDLELASLESRVATLQLQHEEYLLSDPGKRPWAADDAALSERWRQRLQHRLLGLIISGESTATQLIKLRQQITTERDRTHEMKADDVVNLFLNSYAQLYDAHTYYMSPRSSENFRISMSLSLEGIGATLRRNGDYTQVVQLVKGGPAEHQGELKAGDHIVAIAQGDAGDFVQVTGWRLDDVVARIRGERGSTVRLRLLAPGAEITDATGTRVVSIVRDSVKLESQAAQSQVIELRRSSSTYRIGVLRIPSFYLDFRAYENGEVGYRSTTRDVLRLLSEMRQQDETNQAHDDGITGLIIDLRGNGGGSLQEANALTGLFISQGPVVQVRQSNNHILRQGKIRRGPYYDWPLVVLINRLSASAAEIFTAAIQDYDRGLIIGTPSYGKGTVQSLQSLSAGQVRLTDAKFYRISGDSTQLHGIKPDVLFPPSYDAAEIGESSLDNAMQWDLIASVRHRHYYDIDRYLPELRRQHRVRTAQQPEFQYLRKRAELFKQHKQQDTRIPLWEQGRRQLSQQREQEHKLLNDLRQYDADAKPLLHESAELLLDFIALRQL